MCSAIGEGCTIYHSDYTMDCEGLSKIKIVLTLEQRISVLKKIDSGRSVKEVATEFGCGITQISGIKRKRDSLVKQWEDGGRADQKFMKKRKTLRINYFLLCEFFLQNFMLNEIDYNFSLLQNIINLNKYQ